MRLIVSVPVDTVAEVDRLIAADGGRVSRSEFVRQALDLMISRGAGGDGAQVAVRGADGGASEVETHMQSAQESRA
jgi:Arc/MetJ-type ribon-helix-helix transcriptional regulator